MTKALDIQCVIWVILSFNIRILPEHNFPFRLYLSRVQSPLDFLFVHKYFILSTNST